MGERQFLTPIALLRKSTALLFIGLIALYIAAYYFFVTPSDLNFPRFEGDTTPVPFTPAYRVIGSWSPPPSLWIPMLRLDRWIFPRRWGVYPPPEPISPPQL